MCYGKSNEIHRTGRGSALHANLLCYEANLHTAAERQTNHEWTYTAGHDTVTLTSLQGLLQVCWTPANS